MTGGTGRWRAALGAALLAGCVAASQVTGCAAASPAPGAPAAADVARPYVVLVSLDGLRHDDIDRLHPPAIESLARRGIRAASLVPPFPSKTFPSHYTLVTGLHPRRHGIAGNTFFDPARDAWYRSNDTLAVRDGSWYRGEPIWVTAERQGVRTAVYYWPGAEAEIGGRRPATSMRYDAGAPNEQRVDSVVRWLDRPPATRPRLVLVYMSEVDDSTHRYGPDTPQGARAVASVDGAVRRLLDGMAALPIRDSINVVLVSDHGMRSVSPDRSMAVFDALTAAGVDTTGIRASDNGPTMSLWLAGEAPRLARVRTVLARALPQAQVHVRGAAPAHLHAGDEPRFGDLLIVATPGWVLLRRGTDKPPRGGAHGWDPRDRDMHGILVAAGPNVRPLGRVPSVQSVDVHGFIAAMLRLERQPATDGDPRVLEYLRTTPR